MCAWGTTDLVKLNCMPFHPAINSSITTHTCLSFSKLPSLHYRQPWSPGYPRYTGILVYSSHLQVLISQHLAHVSSGDTIYWTCDFQGDFQVRSVKALIKCVLLFLSMILNIYIKHWNYVIYYIIATHQRTKDIFNRFCIES